MDLTTDAVAKRQLGVNPCPVCGAEPSSCWDHGLDNTREPDPDCVIVECGPCKLSLDLTTWNLFSRQMHARLLTWIAEIISELQPKQGAENAPGDFQKQLVRALLSTPVARSWSRRIDNAGTL